MPTPEPLTLWAVPWPEIGVGENLAALVSAIQGLRDGDVVIVTSKVVSKAEGRLVYGDRAAAIHAETRRVVARRGATTIAETRHGLVMAAAGVDASNTPAGTALLLPLDPDATARKLRADVYATAGLNVAVVVSDTAGRAWRIGQTDLAVGCAGLPPLVDLQGTLDTHGNVLQVTAPALADELAGAADLVKGKATGRPVAVARGLPAAVLPPGVDGDGAQSLVRSPAEDLFGLGAREAVGAAVHRSDPDALAHFPPRVGTDPDPFDHLIDRWLDQLAAADRALVRVALTRGSCPTPGAPPAWTLRVDVRADAGAAVLVAAGRLVERADVLAAAHRLVAHDHPAAPEPPWRLVTERCWLDQ